MAKASFIISSEELRTDYHLFVHAQPSSSGGPLVMVLDGDDQFGAALTAADDLRAKEIIPPMTLVGLGYGGSYRSEINRRGRDYTPSQLAGEPSETGGADAFHRFLAGQLLPELIARLGKSPANIGISGHSLSSLFVLYALAQEDPLFSRFLISSPSIWWDERKILESLREASRYPVIGGTKAFLSVGAADSPSMTGDLSLLEAEWAARPREGLEHTVVRFEGLDHYNALPTAYLTGLAWLYGDPKNKKPR